jgi:thiosulfate/3-mercaptopyruvate sulfurtransferase
MTEAEQDDARTAALLLRVWSEPGSPGILRARLVGGAGPDAGRTLATAVGDAAIGQEVLRWLGHVRTGGTTTPPPPAAAPVPALLDADWLDRHRADVAVLQVDDPDDPATAYLPGAARLDWIADLQPADRRGVLDGPGAAALLGRLGVAPGTHVVLAGGARPGLAAWAYFSLTRAGHPRLSLLDGGVPAWAASGRPTSPDPVTPAPVAAARPRTARADLLVGRDQLLAGLLGAPPGTALVDCRTAAEFAGHPRRDYDRPTDRHRTTGHVPGARNLPSEDVLDPAGRFRPAGDLRARCDALGLSPGDQVVVYCGANDRSGLVWFALHELLGWADVRCYPGAWAEYGSLTDAPTET